MIVTTFGEFGVSGFYRHLSAMVRNIHQLIFYCIWIYSISTDLCQNTQRICWDRTRNRSRTQVSCRITPFPPKTGAIEASKICWTGFRKKFTRKSKKNHWTLTKTNSPTTTNNPNQHEWPTLHHHDPTTTTTVRTTIMKPQHQHQ